MTGLIYVVIIALWAAVLIPIWLRRHDQISESRSTARFSSAMRTLGSSDRGASPSRRAVDASMDIHPEDLAITRGSRDTGARMDSNRPSEGMDPSYERELVRQAAATRRAVVLGSLTGLLLLCLVLAIAGVLPKWVPILAALPVVAFVIAASMTASQRTQAPARRGSTRPELRTARRDVAPAPQQAQAEDDWETWNAWDDDEDSWEPVETTLPTYVSAPRASQVPRPIDHAHDGDWSGEAMVETAQAMRSRPRSAPLAAPVDVDYAADTAEIPVVGRARAVNE